MLQDKQLKLWSDRCSKWEESFQACHPPGGLLCQPFHTSPSLANSSTDCPWPITNKALLTYTRPKPTAARGLSFDSPAHVICSKLHSVGNTPSDQTRQARTAQTVSPSWSPARNQRALYEALWPEEEEEAHLDRDPKSGDLHPIRLATADNHDGSPKQPQCEAHDVSHKAYQREWPVQQDMQHSSSPILQTPHNPKLSAASQVLVGRSRPACRMPQRADGNSGLVQPVSQQPNETAAVLMQARHDNMSRSAQLQQQSFSPDQPCSGLSSPDAMYVVDNPAFEPLMDVSPWSRDIDEKPDTACSCCSAGRNLALPSSGSLATYDGSPVPFMLCEQTTPAHQVTVLTVAVSASGADCSHSICKLRVLCLFMLPHSHI